jgi:Subtilase family
VKLFCAFFVFAAAASLQAGDLDTIGVNVLRDVDPTLTGAGIPVAQPEGTSTTNDFEVNPVAVGQPAGLFTWISSTGTASVFPNNVGIESGHADGVGGNFYGASAGVAPQVSHVDNYEADWFFTQFIQPGNPISARVVNQSFIFATNDAPTVNPAYDDYAEQYGTLFVSGIGNGDVPVSPPATCFNGIGVGAYGGGSSAGPTTDGRCKPDLTAPSFATSFSTPYVSGAAAVLLQAADRGDGGANTNAAGNARTVKALLLNGAIKPVGWTNNSATPLDARYGAGIVNVFNAWKQLSGGQHSFIESTSNAIGAPHPPGANTNNEPTLYGWDYNSITNFRSAGIYQEQINHYYFNLDPAFGSAFTLTATLVWNLRTGSTTLNDLNLFLYDAATSNLVACSTSLVDNVEHVFVPDLPPGRYDLQVEKDPNHRISASEPYALAFAMFPLQLNIELTNQLAVLSWPLWPAGLHLESTTNLNLPAAWSAFNGTVTVTNDRNVVSLPPAGPTRFFRLQPP